MTNLLALDNEIAAATMLVIAAQDKEHQLRMQRASTACPHKIGNVVDIPVSDKSWAKHQGKKMMISHIDYTHPVFVTNEMIWVAHGVVLKADGTPSSNMKSFIGFSKYQRDNKSSANV